MFLKLYLWPCQDSPEKVPAAEACPGPAGPEAAIAKAAPVVSEAASSVQTELGTDHGKDLLDVEAGLFSLFKRNMQLLSHPKPQRHLGKKHIGNLVLLLVENNLAKKITSLMRNSRRNARTTRKPTRAVDKDEDVHLAVAMAAAVAAPSRTRTRSLKRGTFLRRRKPRTLTMTKARLTRRVTPRSRAQLTTRVMPRTLTMTGMRLTMETRGPKTRSLTAVALLSRGQLPGRRPAPKRSRRQRRPRNRRPRNRRPKASQRHPRPSLPTRLQTQSRIRPATRRFRPQLGLEDGCQVTPSNMPRCAPSSRHLRAWWPAKSDLRAPSSLHSTRHASQLSSPRG